MEESSEVENDGSHHSVADSHEEDDKVFDSRARGMGIRSSWNGTRSIYRRGEAQEPTPEEGEDLSRQDSDPSNDGKGKMVDIGLESTIADSEPPADLTMETPVDADPPSFQQFKSTAVNPGRFFLRRNSTSESEMGLLRESSVANSLPAPPAEEEVFRHDPFFAWLYLIAVAAMLATFVLIYLHTSTPSSKKPWGDTIYTTLLASFHLLAVDTLIAVVVSMVWLAALRSFVRYLVVLIVVAVPVILFSFSLYPFISSFQWVSGSSPFQDLVMRWTSIIPGVGAFVWLYLVWKGRASISSAIEILEFSSRILAANSALVLVGMGCLALVIGWTWAWLVMFTRVFLGGHFSSRSAMFVISASSWWLGIYFVLVYVWTLSIIAAVQRGTTAATVSQWYFHRNAQPAPSSREVVSAALNHSMTTIFGSISLSTLLALLVRLPLLVLPRRVATMMHLFFYTFIPTSIISLTNPLTLTYAAIHSQNLATSARGLTQMDFLSPNAPTTTLTPRAFRGNRSAHAPLLPYRLAKLLLHATRIIMATGLGFAGWVMTARQLRITIPSGGGITGSAYAYVVGLVAGFIGWGVLGAMEGILSGIVDAVVICYGSETRMASGGGGYCMEAAYLFGDRREDRERSVY